MKRWFALRSASLLALFAFASTAQAVSPHFVSASAHLSGTNLMVDFKEAGPGTNQLITYVASADSTVTYVCVNRGGANPSASNKTTISGPGECDRNIQLRQERPGHFVAHAQPTATWQLLLPIGAKPSNRTGQLHQRGHHRHDQRRHRADPRHLHHRVPPAGRARRLLDPKPIARRTGAPPAGPPSAPEPTTATKMSAELIVGEGNNIVASPAPVCHSAYERPRTMSHVCGRHAPALSISPGR